MCTVQRPTQQPQYILIPRDNYVTDTALELHSRLCNLYAQQCHTLHKSTTTVTCSTIITRTVLIDIDGC